MREQKAEVQTMRQEVEAMQLDQAQSRRTHAQQMEQQEADWDGNVSKIVIIPQGPCTPEHP